MTSDAGASLRDVIPTRGIRRNGPIRFSRYMELCLYEPELGYYSRAREKFGKAGDFYTSSDVHAVFGRLLARQFEEVWRVSESPVRFDVIELGRDEDCLRATYLTGRRGSSRVLRLPCDTRWSSNRRTCERNFTSVLPSMSQAGSARSTIRWNRLPHRPARTSSSSAMSSSMRFQSKSSIIGARCEWLSSQVASWNNLSRLQPLKMNFSTGTVFIRKKASVVEAPLSALGWMDRIAAVFHKRRGFVVLIDYGYTREQQLAGRHRDTLMTYRQHLATSSPYEALGEQDITTHVNFTALRGRGTERGLEPLALLTQSQFLIGIGEETQFADAFQDCRLPQEQAKVALQLKHLISPEAMGETFQVLLMSHGLAKEKAASLGGLKLAR